MREYLLAVVLMVVLSFTGEIWCGVTATIRVDTSQPPDVRETYGLNNYIVSLESDIGDITAFSIGFYSLGNLKDLDDYFDDGTEQGSLWFNPDYCCVYYLMDTHLLVESTNASGQPVIGERLEDNADRLTALVRGIDPTPSLDIANISLTDDNMQMYSIFISAEVNGQEYCPSFFGCSNPLELNYSPFETYAVPPPGFIYDAGGPYVTDPGEGIDLDASGSVPGMFISDFEDYLWDTDGDGEFGSLDTDGIGGTGIPEPTGKYVNGFYSPLWEAGGEYEIAMKAIQNGGAYGWGTSTVTVTPEPTLAGLLIAGGMILFFRRGE